MTATGGVPEEGSLIAGASTGPLVVARRGEGVDDESPLVAAMSYAVNGLAIFPLARRSKVPLFPSVHSAGDSAGAECKGRCGLDGHGLHDATTDVDRVVAWWTAYPNANIGGAVPPGAFVLDVDPRNGGGESLAGLIAEYGPLTRTLAARSGGRDRGVHLWFRHPGGHLVVPKNLIGLDLRACGTHVVLPPSVHPSGGLYSWIDVSVPIVLPPAWLADTLRPIPAEVFPARRRSPWKGPSDGSIIGWFNAKHTFGDLLRPRGWTQLDAEGTRWKHPRATSDLSATVRDDRLYVYSTNTVFHPTAAGDPHGYDVFDTFATLEHRGDLASAARAARSLRRRGLAA